MRRRTVIAAGLAVACYGARVKEPALSHAEAATAATPDSQAVGAAAGATAPISTSAPALPAVATASPAAARTPAAREPCPAEMALVRRPQGAFCIDRWEASLDVLTAGGGRAPWPSNHGVDGREAEMAAVSAAGRKPQGYVNGVQAARACENAGKRLCAIDEWVRACRGPKGQKYPYGDERRPDVCNDRFKTLDQHPVVALFNRVEPPGADRARMWLPAFMNDPRLHELPRTVEPAGSRPECRSEYGVYDLVGNLHEWVADPEGTFVGGFFMDTFQNGEGCGYRTTAHDTRYHDYSTGFRCCRDAAVEGLSAPATRLEGPSASASERAR